MRLDGFRQGPKVYARGPRRHSLWPLLTAVLVVHVAVLWGLQRALHSHGTAKRDRSVGLIYLPPPVQNTAPQPPAPTPQPKPEDKPTRRASPRVPPAAPPATTLTLQPENPTTTHAPVAAAPPASAAASEAATPLLDTAATRQAIRDIAARPLNAERAAAVTGAAAPLSAEETMAQRAQSALKGDCAKGEFAGGGMGILSLPALAVAAARGDCRR